MCPPAQSPLHNTPHNDDTPVCIEEWLSRDRTCPNDRAPLSLHDLRPAHRLLRGMVSRLRLVCPHDGCATVLTLERFEEHVKACAHLVPHGCNGDRRREDEKHLDETWEQWSQRSSGAQQNYMQRIEADTARTIFSPLCEDELRQRWELVRRWWQRMRERQQQQPVVGEAATAAAAAAAAAAVAGPAPLINPQGHDDGSESDETEAAPDLEYGPSTHHADPPFSSNPAVLSWPPPLLPPPLLPVPLPAPRAPAAELFQGADAIDFATIEMVRWDCRVSLTVGPCHASRT